MHRIGLIILLILGSNFSFAQNGRYFVGATSSGMSEANINSADCWSLFNNPAGLGFQEAGAILTSYQNRLNAAAFQTLGFGLIFPTGKIVPGISIYRFGDDIFNQQKLSFSLGSKLQIVSLGLSVNWIQNKFSELGNVNAFSVEFGGIAEIVRGFRIGAHIFNLNQGSFIETQQLPVMMRCGLSYLPTEYFILTGELEKHIDQKENLKIGFNYFITDWVALQTGFATYPKSFSFGMGLHPKTWSFNYAFVSLSPIGSVHEISLSKSLRPHVKEK